MKKPKSRTKSHVVWGGFTDGKLCWMPMDDRWGGVTRMTHKPALFSTRREAREQFEDVRKVVICEA